ncbi:MAG: nuclear transport factor 2 family protein [Syntrophaceae bacterium]
MITQDQADKFAKEWIAAWNERNLDLILDHYTSDFELTSPLIVQLTGDSSGTLKGKSIIKMYFLSGIARFPDAHFELVEVLAGVNSIVIYYKAMMGKRAAEMCIFDSDGKIMKSMVHYR